MITTWDQKNKESQDKSGNEIKSMHSEICRNFYIQLFSECSIRNVPKAETIIFLSFAIEAIAKAHITASEQTIMNDGHEEMIDDDILEDLKNHEKILRLEDQLGNKLK